MKEFKEMKRLYKYLNFCVKNSYYVSVCRKGSNFLYVVTSYNKYMVDLYCWGASFYNHIYIKDFLRKWKPVFISKVLSNKVHEAMPRHNFLVSSTYCALLYNNAKEEYVRSKVYK